MKSEIKIFFIVCYLIEAIIFIKWFLIYKDIRKMKKIKVKVKNVETKTSYNNTTYTYIYEYKEKTYNDEIKHKTLFKPSIGDNFTMYTNKEKAITPYNMFIYNIYIILLISLLILPLFTLIS